MDKQREWTSKLSATAQIASPTIQVLVHEIPFSFNPEDLEQIKELEKKMEGISKALEYKKPPG